MYEPAPGYVLCRPLKAEATTASGLKLPDTYTKKDANIAEVIKPGENRLLISQPNHEGQVASVKEWMGAPLDEGDIIAYRPYTDIEVEEGYDKLVFVPYSEIVAVKRSIKNES